MCTVTYLPIDTKGSFILTSNRDERINRPALPPARYTVHGKELVFPKDLEKEGTWICVHTSWVLCLLNGAFVKHKHEPPYRKSRGIVLLDFYSFNKPEDFASHYDFTGIEPFTLLILGLENPEALYEFRWDGHKAFLNFLDASIPHIRSSATLYTPEVVKMREDWFEAWIQKHSEFSQEAILDFHHFSDSGERSHDVLMQKNELLKTVSITSISRLDQRLGIKYEDLLKETVDSCSLIV